MPMTESQFSCLDVSIAKNISGSRESKPATQMLLYIVIQTIYNMMIYIIVSLIVVILVVFDKY